MREGRRLAARARAKINLFLEVTGRRADGYHDIDSVFLEIDLADEISASPTEDGRVELVCDNPALPVDERNLAVRAALALRQGQTRDGREGIRFSLKKRIPAGGGLGGGSSDAAAALRLANALWECGLSDAELLPIAAATGSDVPFFLRGGMCRCRGRGEIINPLPGFPEGIEIGLALPPFSSSTAEAYRGVRLPAPDGIRSPEAFLAATARGDVRAMREEAFNRFEESVFRALPALGRLHRELEALLGHSVRMSGSGSSLWFFAEQGWRENALLAAWGEANRVRLLPARSAGGGGKIVYD